MKLVRAEDSAPSQRSSRFTGEPLLTRKLDEQQLAGMRVAVVSFGPGVRTFWHNHHGEQLLYVITGDGWVQKAGEERFEIRPGDLVYVSPREEHWHGAQTATSMRHLAVTIGATEWGHEVSDAD
jgi:quercetin dioxygenase-like cupin family protein